MAGGEGSRLRPLTINRPSRWCRWSPSRSLGHILDLLKRHGITESYFTLYYLPEDIQEYYGDGHSLGMKIYYAIEETPSARLAPSRMRSSTWTSRLSSLAATR